MTLDRWLRQKRMSETAFARLVDESCTQSLVSKWRRGLVLPSLSRRVAIALVTGRLVTERGLIRHNRQVKRARAATSLAIAR